jgi:hypothetical protein
MFIPCNVAYSTILPQIPIKSTNGISNLCLYKKLCRQQPEVIQNHENEYRKYKRLKFGGGQAYDY